jgi:hypothetical protein
VLIKISAVATLFAPPSTINVAVHVGALVIAPRNPQLNGSVWAFAGTGIVYIVSFVSSDMLIASHGWLRWRAMASIRSQALRTLMISSSHRAACQQIGCLVRSD